MYVRRSGSFCKGQICQTFSEGVISYFHVIASQRWRGLAKLRWHNRNTLEPHFINTVRSPDFKWWLSRRIVPNFAMTFKFVNFFCQRPKFQMKKAFSNLENLYTLHLEIQGNFTSYICYPQKNRTPKISRKCCIFTTSSPRFTNPTLGRGSGRKRRRISTQTGRDGWIDVVCLVSWFLLFHLLIKGIYWSSNPLTKGGWCFP